MEEQALGERQHGGGSLLAHYWSKVVAALRNPVTLTASAWGFFYLWCVSVPCMDCSPG